MRHHEIPYFHTSRRGEQGSLTSIPFHMLSLPFAKSLCPACPHRTCQLYLSCNISWFKKMQYPSRKLGCYSQQWLQKKTATSRGTTLCSGHSPKRRLSVSVDHFEYILVKLFTHQSGSMGTDFLLPDKWAIREFNSLLNVGTVITWTLQDGK